MNSKNWATVDHGTTCHATTAWTQLCFQADDLLSRFATSDAAILASLRSCLKKSNPHSPMPGAAMRCVHVISCSPWVHHVSSPTQQVAFMSLDRRTEQPRAKLYGNLSESPTLSNPMVFQGSVALLSTISRGVPTGGSPGPLPTAYALGMFRQPSHIRFSSSVPVGSIMGMYAWQCPAPKLDT